MLIDTSLADPGLEANLTSPVQIVNAFKSYCLYFWYYMRGINTGQIDVYVISTNYGEQLIWSNNQSRGNFWAQGRATINGSLNSFSVRGSFKSPSLKCHSDFVSFTEYKNIPIFLAQTQNYVFVVVETGVLSEE